MIRSSAARAQDKVRCAFRGLTAGTSIARSHTQTKNSGAVSLLLGNANLSNRVAYFSTKVVDVRRAQQNNIWEDYLQSGAGAEDLFAELDLNYSNTISVLEINYFLESVSKKGVSEDAFQTLQKLGEDHELDLLEFKQWLGMATDVAQVEVSQPEPPVSKPKEEESPPNEPQPKKKLVDARHGLQKLVWDHYISTGKNGDDLFLMIDLNKNGKISPLEVSYFLESVGKQGVKEEAFTDLVAMGDDHDFTKDEFVDWLESSVER
mmetsp:Transcript_3955/g.8410  ORF Transcript_3955/g.8410 Transcript_3955/m.8410 type:complete len:263 (-) Transcript_3955:309-1097(-)